MYSISRWGGRFGNNIQQISNAIFYCMENGFNFRSPPNDLINSFDLKFGETDCAPKIFFFHVDSKLGNGKSDFNVDLIKLKQYRRKICRDIIFDYLKLDFGNIEKFDDDTVVAHIRSGDIFHKKNYYCPVVSNYIQNPLSYYLEMFEKYKKCIVLTEDYRNPVVEELEKVKNIEIRVSSVDKTIETILSTQNLITPGVSSFSIACALLSKNIKKIHATNINLEEIISIDDFVDSDVEKVVKNINMANYINYNTWINSDDQRKLMINYK